MRDPSSFPAPNSGDRRSRYMAILEASGAMHSEDSRQCRASTSEFGRCGWEAGQHVIESHH
jgi:hypothetical protein